jgi:hypothetical protein
VSAHPPGAQRPSLPPAPWVLVDTTTIEQAAAALALLETWLLSGDPAATTAAAHALSGGEDDPTGAAHWAGTLAELLRHRIEEASTWS